MAKQTALIIGQDGAYAEVEYDEKNQLRVLQDAVGGYIESVDWMGFKMDAYANEEGFYTPGLTVNVSVLVHLRKQVLGNVVIPRLTPNKREKLRKMGFQA